MEKSVLNFSKSVWNFRIILLIGLFFVAYNDATYTYGMQNYCNKELSFISIYEDQIKLDFDDNIFYDILGHCEATFEARYSTYPKFMFYFEYLNLDCDDGHLEFYTGTTGDDRVSGLDRNICGSNKPQDVFTVDKRYFRINYVPKREQFLTNLFSLIITTYDDGHCASYAHKCENSRCIDEDLTCNGYDSCGDGSDCNLSTGAIIGIVIGCIAGLAVIISVVICCICCMRRSRGTPGSVQNTGGPAVVYNAQNQNRYNQPIYGINPGSTNNPGPSPYVVPIATGTPNAPSDQQRYSYSQPMYGVNQGSNYPSANQMSAPTIPSNTGTTHEYSDLNYSDPRSSYNELVVQSEQTPN